MAEKFSFFDPFLQDGVYDREYNAQDFTNYFKALVTTGVMRAVGSQLAVSANGTNMATTVSDGIAYILGRYYENTSTVEHIHDTESLGNTRIDRIVIRMSLEPHDRSVVSAIKKGVASTNPAPPALVQNDNIYEISLAQVRITGGQTFIATDAVTSERGIDVICPWAGSNILPSFDDNALSEHINTTQLHKITQTNGSPLAMTNNNPNDTKATGLYYGQSTNFPSNDFYYLSVISNPNDNNFCMQKIRYAFGDTEYTRILINGAWSPWKQSTFGTETINQWNSGYDTYKRFQGVCSLVTDWNLVGLNGMYMSEPSGLNGPITGEWVMGTVTVHNDLYISQKVMQVTGNREWERKKNSGVWGAWTETSPMTLFQSVSNGKTAIANAITGKGISTAANAEFATMANNISNIQTFRTANQYYTVNPGSAARYESSISFNAGFPIRHVAVYFTNIKYGGGNGTGAGMLFQSGTTSYSLAGGASNSSGVILCGVSPYLHSNPSYSTAISGNVLNLYYTVYSSTYLDSQTFGITVQAWG